MGYLVAAVVLLGVLCLLNLLFTLGILRRMRTTAVWQPEPSFALGPGSAVGAFSVMTTTLTVQPLTRVPIGRSSIRAPTASTR